MTPDGPYHGIMSWSEDMRCLFCDGKLPVYRKITNGQFCSSAHQKAYWKQQEALAVERLSRTHESLLASLPAVAALTPPLHHGLISERRQRPHAAMEELARQAGRPDAVRMAEYLPDAVTASNWHPSDWHPIDKIDKELFVDDPLGRLGFVLPEQELSPLRPGATRQTVTARGLAYAGAVKFGRAKAQDHLRQGHRRLNGPTIKSMEPSVEPASRAIDLALAPEQPLMFTDPEEIAALSPPAEPPLAGPLAMPPLCEAVCQAAAIATEAVPLAWPLAMPPLCEAVCQPAAIAAETVPFAGPLAMLPLCEAVCQPAAIAAEAVPLESAEAPVSLGGSSLTTPAKPLRRRLASAARYPMSAVLPKPQTGGVEPVATDSFTVAFPDAQLDPEQFFDAPAFAGLLALPFAAGTPAAQPVGARVTGILALYPKEPDPKLPVSRLAPINGAPAAAPPRSLSAFANLTADDPLRSPNFRQQATDFWSNAPRDLKLALFAIPILVGMAFHPRLPKVHMEAPAANARTHAQIDHNFQKVLARPFDAMQQNLASRAGVALVEDFRSGMDDWQMHSELSTPWSFDSNGFVRPGSLALYRPSLHLSDYELQFAGVIDQKALSFVVRAKDFENFYVIKLMVTHPGPLPSIGITRYAVIDGKAQHRADTVAAVVAPLETLYHVELTVHDDTYLLSLQGKVVDSWSEPGLTQGGIGFFSARGEQSRVRWVQVTHQNDMLGRLCAFLAPNNIPN